MKHISYGAIAGAIASVVLLHNSFARPSERPGLNGPTFPCQSCGTVFSFDPATRSEKVLHSFQDDGVDGWYPYSSVVENNGKLYGTTSYGGSSTSCSEGCGTIYSIDIKTGAEKVLYSFLGGTDGSIPEGSLLAVGDLFYGTTATGGNGGVGTVFSFDPKTRMETVVYSFQQNDQDGGGATASLIDVDGILYGTTAGGGTYGLGTVFSVDPTNGSETVLHSFGNGEDGQSPYTNVTAVGSMLFGTTYSGGTNGAGTVFLVNLATHTETIVYSFTDGDDGAGPYGGLIRAAGRLYGTTVDDDNCNNNGNGQGSVYAIDIANGSEINVHCFSQGGGLEPFGSLIKESKLFYGTTSEGGNYGCNEGSGCGTIFSMTKKGRTKTLYSFCSQTNCADGAVPGSGVIDVGGIFYGTTVNGGSGAGKPARHQIGEVQP